MLENLIFSGSGLSYLTPAFVMVCLLALVPVDSGVHAVFRPAGVLVHELLHLTVGLITFARPTSFSVIPKREGKKIVLGSVGFANLNWMNAWLTALAPLLVIPFLLVGAEWRISQIGAHVQWWDALVWLGATVLLQNCLPSGADWRLALISWPILCVLASAFVVYGWAHDWSFLFAWSSVAS